jgi:RNA polymerase sigma-70 factor (ECF subfamily)
MGRRAEREIEVLFRQHYVPLVRGLSLAAGSADAAADAVQDAFVQLHRHWRKVSGYDEPAAWLRRVAVHRVADQRRGARRKDAAVSRLSAGLSGGLSGGVDATTEPAADHSDLHAAIAALPRGQRLVVGLHHLGGLPVSDVAAALDISEGTVKSQLHDARANLRSALEVRHV